MPDLSEEEEGSNSLRPLGRDDATQKDDARPFWGRRPGLGE